MDAKISDAMDRAIAARRARMRQNPKKPLGTASGVRKPSKRQARGQDAKPLPVARLRLNPSHPAPRLAEVIAHRGVEPTTAALNAWECRIRGQPIVDLAHGLNMTIEGAKALLREAHDAIKEDLKDSIELNRSLDLERVDSLIYTYLPLAKAGDQDAATLLLKCVSQRARLTGSEPSPNNPGNGQPQNVLVWVQQQLPAINRLVDALPLE